MLVLISKSLVPNDVSPLQTLRFVQSLPVCQKKNFAEAFPKVDPLALDLMEKMLNFDPLRRMTATEALSHPYLSEFHDPEDEPVAESTFDWSSLDHELTAEEWKRKSCAMGKVLLKLMAPLV